MGRNRKPELPGQETEIVLAEATPQYQEFENVVPERVPMPVLCDSNAYSVVRNGDKYQLVCIPFNKLTLEVGVPVVLFENNDRWEIQSQFSYQADVDFLLVEDIKK